MKNWTIDIDKKFDGKIGNWRYYIREKTKTQQKGRQIAEVNFSLPDVNEITNLIAAAPDLLEACKWAAKQYHHPSCKVNKDRVDTGQNCNCFIGAAKAAIAKAECGGQEVGCDGQCNQCEFD